MDTQVTNSAEHQLNRRVGNNVRAVREELSKPRRVLAEETGISERYIGQLETGRANISLNVLAKIASALEVSMIDLISGGHGPLNQLLATLSDRQQDEAYGLLRRHFAQDRRGMSGIALVGLRGAGKSTLGKQLARSLGIPFVQLTELVTERAGMTTQELVELGGLDAFRRLEREALEDLISKGKKVVLETSGGLVGAPDAYQLVLDHFRTIWIKARPEEHMQRVVEQNDLRPMEGRPQAMDDLNALLSARQQAYGQADEVVDTSGLDVQRTAELMQHAARGVL